MFTIAALTLCLSASPDAGASQAAVVIQPVANMYAAPSADTEVISQARYAANVAVLEQKDDWARIRTADDYRGWISTAALRRGRTYATQGRVAEVQSLRAISIASRTSNATRRC